MSSSIMRLSGSSDRSLSNSSSSSDEESVSKSDDSGSIRGISSCWESG